MHLTSAFALGLAVLLAGTSLAAASLSLHAGRPEPVVRTLPSASQSFYRSEHAFVVLSLRQFLLSGAANGARGGQP